MKYVLDTEFIDTPTCSALISLAVVREDGRSRYFEFDFPRDQLTPWLLENVVPHLNKPSSPSSFVEVARAIEDWIGNDKPEFWCYYGAYDWYWFCRLWGGFMAMPTDWPMRFKEFADIQEGIPNVAGVEHHALNDCRAQLHAMKLCGIV